jgi:alpha-tubulin suppressor-like RCC1 family protein
MDGTMDINYYSYTPGPVLRGQLGNRTISMFKSGYSHTCFLTTDQLIFCGGDNSRGQLGSGTSAAYIPYPMLANTTDVMLGKTITRIFLGGYISFALTSDNLLYGWGSLVQAQGMATSYGAGNNAAFAAKIPIVVDLSAIGTRKITDLAVSASNALLLTSDGALFSFGDSRYYIVRCCHISTNATEWRLAEDRA